MKKLFLIAGLLTSLFSQGQRLGQPLGALNGLVFTRGSFMADQGLINSRLDTLNHPLKDSSGALTFWQNKLWLRVKPAWVAIGSVTAISDGNNYPTTLNVTGTTTKTITLILLDGSVVTGTFNDINTGGNYKLPFNNNSGYYLGGDSILHLFPISTSYTKSQVDSIVLANKTSGGNYKLPYNGLTNYYLGGDSSLHLLPSIGSTLYRLPYNGNTNYYLGGDSVLHILPTIPTNDNQLANGAGYITSSALSPYLTSANAITLYQPLGTNNYKLPYNGSVTSYLGGDSALHALPTIPTNTSQLTNNSGFLTANQPITVTATGDATGTSTSSPTAPSLPLVLTTVNNNVGTFTNATVTVNAKGLVTGVSTGSAGSTGTVTSVATNDGTGIIGGTITNSGTLSIDTTNTISTKANVIKIATSVASNTTNLAVIDSVKTSFAEANVVSIPIGTIIKHFGDSYTLADTYTQTMDSLAELRRVNYGVGNTTISTVTDNVFIQQASVMNANPATVLAGLNDIHYLGNSLPVMERVKGAIKSIIANHYLRTAVAANDASVTTTGTWTTDATAIGKASHLSSGLTRTSSVAGSTLTVTLTGTEIVIGCFGSDSTQSNDGKFTVTVDGVLKSAFIPNGKNLYKSGVSATRSPNLLFISGLSNTSHTVIVTTIENKPTLIDYFGTLQTGDYQPLLIGRIPKVPLSPNTAAYGTGTQGTLTYQTADSTSSYILAGINEFTVMNLPICFVNTNKYIAQTLTDFQSDSLHPTTAGYIKIGKAFLEHISQWNTLEGLHQTGTFNTNKYIWGSGLVGGNLFLNGTANSSKTGSSVVLQSVNGNVGIGTSTTTPSSLLTIKGATSVIELQSSTGTDVLYNYAGSGYNAIATNRHPSTGAVKNSGLPTSQIILNNSSGNGSIDVYATNTNGAAPTLRFTILGTGGVIYKTASSEPATPTGGMAVWYDGINLKAKKPDGSIGILF